MSLNMTNSPSSSCHLHGLAFGTLISDLFVLALSMTLGYSPRVIDTELSAHVVKNPLQPGPSEQLWWMAMARMRPPLMKFTWKVEMEMFGSAFSPNG